MSAPYTAGDAVKWTGGVLLQGRAETEFAGTSIDTRSTRPGMLFVAIVGEKHDAHAFLDQAIRSGAAGLVVTRGHSALAGLGSGDGKWKPDLPVLATDDTTRALGALAAGHRARFEGPVVAITGSNGKTTTKEMCAAILSQRAPCLKNEGNLNNQFGLPLTLLRRETPHEFAVVELGMNHRGEIAALTAIAVPSVGIVTNVGTAHVENLGSLEEIAREKGDLIAALPAGATAVLNDDDRWADTLARRTRANVLRFGRGRQADLRGQVVSAGGENDGALHFELSCPLGSCEISVAGMGDATLENALAASGAALAAGASLEEIERGLCAYRPVAGRLTRIDLHGDVVILDDTYNANPQSMENALRALAALPRNRHIAVLGAMGELGANSEDAHLAVGRLAAQLEFDTVFAVGEGAQGIAGGALEKGMPPSRVISSASCEAASEQLIGMLATGDGVLVKGSRSARMERIVEALTSPPAKVML